MGEQQTLGGLGAAVGLMFALIALISFAVPALLFLVSCIGNFASKGKRVIAFTVVSIVAEVLAVAILFFVNLFTFDGTLYDVVMVGATAILNLAVLVSFVISIIVLAKQKTALDE